MSQGSDNNNPAQIVPTSQLEGRDFPNLHTDVNPTTKTNSVKPRNKDKLKEINIDWGKLSDQIGKYSVSITDINGKPQEVSVERVINQTQQFAQSQAESEVLNFLGGNQNEKARKAFLTLYKGTNDPASTRAREAYLAFLKKKEKDIPLSQANSKTTLNQLLGAEGEKLYRAALIEEENSREYRTAVFLASCVKYKGNSNIPDEIEIGGSSGAGKTTAVKNILAEFEGNIDKRSVMVDNGISRELSQMRQFTNGFADMKGHPQITDLQDKDIKCKSHVEKAAKQANLGTIAPKTFTDPNDWLSKRKKGYNHITIQVKIDDRICREMGEARAESRLSNKERSEKYEGFDLQSKCSHESKAASTSTKPGARLTNLRVGIAKLFGSAQTITYNNDVTVQMTTHGNKDIKYIGSEREWTFLTELQKLSKEFLNPNIEIKNSEKTINIHVKNEITALSKNYLENNTSLGKEEIKEAAKNIADVLEKAFLKPKESAPNSEVAGLELGAIVEALTRKTSENPVRVLPIPKGLIEEPKGQSILKPQESSGSQALSVSPSNIVSQKVETTRPNQSSYRENSLSLETVENAQAAQAAQEKEQPRRKSAKTI